MGYAASTSNDLRFLPLASSRFHRPNTAGRRSRIAGTLAQVKWVWRPPPKGI